MHQSIPPAPNTRPPSPPPRAAAARSPAGCQSQGGALANFALPGGRAFASPRAIPELLTRTQFYQNITTQKVLLEKKQIGLSVKDRNKL